MKPPIIFYLLISFFLSSLQAATNFLDFQIEKDSNPFEILSPQNTFPDPSKFFHSSSLLGKAEKNEETNINLNYPKVQSSETLENIGFLKNEKEKNENLISDKSEKNDKFNNFLDKTDSKYNNFLKPPNSAPTHLKCLICNEVYLNKFDFQIMIEQQKRCEFFENKYSINRDSCIQISKNIAYKFFDNGGDSSFERELALKIKNCRNLESKQELNALNENGCDKVGNRVCEILLNLNSKDCETAGKNTIDLMQFKEEKSNFENQPKNMKEWSPPSSLKFKNVYSSVDKDLDEISELEKTVKDLEQKLKEAKQNLFNKIVEAQASSKAIQDHLNQIITRVKTEMRPA